MNTLTIDSTGNMKDQKRYVLTVGEDTIGLTKRNLGPADINFTRSALGVRTLATSAIANQVPSLAHCL